MSWIAVAFTAAAVATGATVLESRKARKQAQRAVEEETAREKAQIDKEEKALEESQLAAQGKKDESRRSRALRRGLESTQVAGRAPLPNLTRLAQSRKKDLGSSA